MTDRQNPLAVVAAIFLLTYQPLSIDAIALGPASAPMQGLMVSLGARANPDWYPDFPKQFTAMLDYVCKNHRTRGTNKQFVGDLVLLDTCVADTTVSKWIFGV
jgi:hypothetical protein